MSDKVLRLYDSLSRTVKPIETVEPGVLRFYTCGPTVYSFAHIGNFRSFLTADLVVRTAKAIGMKVVWVTNITDVGHLTEDNVADGQGEDKMEKALRSKEGEKFHNVWELAEHYTDAYKDDWARLNLTEPDVRPKATQHVREQIKAAEVLIDKGYAYETPTGVYFSVEKFPSYGKLSGNTQEKLRKGSVRDVVLDEYKQDQSDFAIWKKDDKHLMQWFSPFGWGFPGWHIECSVMARAYLGDTIDLHSGGEDNMFPHHECEIAQSEALTGKTFCNHWIHTRFLMVNGEKMAKSSGNFYVVRDLVKEPVDGLALRYALISGVYGKPFNFTDQLLRDARTNIERFWRAKDLASTASGPGEDTVGERLDALYDAALDAMCNDLNTSVALAKALEGAKLIAKEPLNAASGESALNFLAQVNQLLGIVDHEPAHIERLGLGRVEDVQVVVDPDGERIEALIAERLAAKQAKNFARADEIRNALVAEGIALVDTPDGKTSWSRA